MDETVMLLNRMGEQFAKAGNTAAAEQCFDKAHEAHEAHDRVARLREVAMQSEELDVTKLHERAAS